LIGVLAPAPTKGTKAKSSPVRKEIIDAQDENQ
jgi:hypothetical protein